MRSFAITLLLLLGGATGAAAQQTLVLTNGDRLSGRLTKIDGATWVFAHSAGDLKVPATDVAEYSTTNPVGLRLADGTILAATVSAANGQLRLAGSDGTTRTVAATDLAAVGDPATLDALVPVRIGYFTPIGRFWGATAGLGFSDKSGNSRSRGLTADLAVGRRSPRDRLSLRLGVAREESLDPDGDTLQTTVEKYYGSARADVFFSPRLFAFASTAQERDKFQGIDLRSNYNAGLGVQLIATDQTDLRFSASAGLRREAFTDVALETNSTPILAAGTEFRQTLGPAVFAWSVDWAPSTKDLEDYRFVSEASLTTTVFQGLGFRIASRNEINNRPPAQVPALKKHDMLLTTALTYSIGR